MLMFSLPLVWIYQFLSEMSYYKELQLKELGKNSSE